MKHKPQDSVCIEGLTVSAVIGVFDWEREITQPLVIDLIMYASQSKASESDHIDDALDYKKICEQVTSTVQACQAHLIETVAEKVTQMLLTDFIMESVQVTVRKPTAIKETEAVGVCITRYSKD